MGEPAGSIYLSLQRVAGVTILHAHGLVTPASADTLRERISNVIDHGARRIVVDIEHLEIVDTAGIRELLACERLARLSRGRLVLGAVPQDVVDVLRENGMHRQLLCFRTAEAAITHLQR
jgi:anti-sigma B factor antagonist